VRRRDQRVVAWAKASGAGRIVPMTLKPPDGPAQDSTRPGRAGWARPADLGHRRVGSVWGHDNLHIVDASLHVTNGGVNPVLTILALAYRVSRRVAESRRADGE
jgi:GMC oxidoreductase